MLGEEGDQQDIKRGKPNYFKGSIFQMNFNVTKLPSHGNIKKLPSHENIKKKSHIVLLRFSSSSGVHLRKLGQVSCKMVAWSAALY